MTERTLLSYTASPDPRVVDCYSGIEVIRRQHETTGQLLVAVGTNHSARRTSPEARGIRNEFFLAMHSPHGQVKPVKVYTEASTFDI